MSDGFVGGGVSLCNKHTRWITHRDDIHNTGPLGRDSTGHWRTFLCVVRLEKLLSKQPIFNNFRCLIDLREHHIETLNPLILRSQDFGADALVLRGQASEATVLSEPF